jgi:membrane protease YdiL (CAAX protease family)
MTAAVSWSAAYTNRTATTEIVEFWSDPVNTLWATLLFYPLALICLLVCRHALDRRSLSSLGLQPSLPHSIAHALRGFGGGAACGALAISFLFGILWSSGAVRIVGFSPEAFGGGLLTSIAMLTLYALLFFAVGFMEELMFRGYALHNLRAWLGIPVAIAVQAIVFALAHSGNGATEITSQLLYDARWAMLNIALIGWFFALAYIKTGTLWFPIGFHVAWNWFLGCVWSLPVSGIPVFRILDVTSSENVALSGGRFGAEGSILLAPLILAMLWLLRGLPDHPQAVADLDTLSPPYIEDDAAAPVSLAEESDWPEPDPNRERRFKASMRAEATPQIAGAELDQLARELEESAHRAAPVREQQPAPVLPTIPESRIAQEREATPPPVAVQTESTAFTEQPAESPQVPTRPQEEVRETMSAPAIEEAADATQSAESAQSKTPLPPPAKKLRW